MCTSKYVTMNSITLPEKICDIAQPILTKKDIWNQRLMQCGKYRGLKFLLTRDNLTLIKQIMRYSRQAYEKSKNLKAQEIVTV